MLNNKLKILDKFLFISFLFIIFVYTSHINAESTLTKYNKELYEVRQQEKENASKLTGIEKDIAEYNYEISDLDTKMMEATSDLADLKNKENKLKEELKENEDALKDTSKIYEKSEKEYASRLRLVYENGVPNIFEFLFSSRGIADFLSKVNIYQRILEYNKDLVTTIKGKKNYIDYVKKNVENQQKELELLEDDVQKNIKTLNETLEQKQAKLQELENSQSTLKKDNEQLVKKREDAIKKIDEEIERAYRKSLSNNLGASTEFTGGNFAWPVPGYNVITTTFGFVYYLVKPSGSAHTGADIAGANIFGKPIVAAESGSVIVAGYNAGGYGNYVMIDHGKCTEDGKNYITLYGHASALAVQQGDNVIKGQTIAYVGSTGNSTGPHLHYELRINGKITDPLIQYPSLTFDYR